MIEYERYPLYIKPVPMKDRDKVPLIPLKIMSCNKCGFVYQKVTFDINELSKIYESIYKSYHSPAISGIGSSLAHDFLQFLENSVSVNLKNKKVLEIGCYDGYFLSLLRDKYSCSVVGCDPSPGSKIAKEIGIEVINAYFSPDLFDENFDIIVLRGIIEHIINPISFLKAVEKVTAENGIIAIEVPNVRYSLKNGVIGDFFHEHISYFTKNSLIHCLNLSGFETVKIEDTEYYIRATFKIPKSFSKRAENIELKKEILKIKQLFGDYNENIKRLVYGLNELCETLSDEEIYVYGGGGHTIGLLSKTDKFLRPIGVIDGDPSKEGKYIPGFNLPVYSKEIIENLDLEKSVIIVSSKIFQNEIINELKHYINNGLKVVKLYPVVGYVKTNNDKGGR
jgi:SAM-dependent methyltransferase